MDQTAIDRIESSLRVTLPEDYRQFLMSRTAEVAQLKSALEFVATPWIDPDEIIRQNSNRETWREGTTVQPDNQPWPVSYFLIGTNGAGDFWFIDLGGAKSGVWFYEHETGEVQSDHATLDDWIFKLRHRLAKQAEAKRLASEKAAREYAQLTFSGAGISSLFAAAQDMESTDRLAALIAAGHDVNTVNQNRFAATPLHAAASRGNRAAVELLLKAGANVNAVDADGASPIHACSQGGIVEALLAHGAQPSLVNKRGATPLHSGAYFGREAAVRALLAHGSDKTIRDTDGKLPVDLARERGHEQVAALLA